MKGTVSIFYLAILLCLMGSDWMFVHIQKQIRKEVKTKIKKGVPSNELFYFTSKNPRAEFHWIKVDKEFEMNGHLYDVVRTRVLESHVVELACVDDWQEAQLFQHLDFACKHTGDNGNLCLQHFAIKYYLVDMLPNQFFPDFYLLSTNIETSTTLHNFYTNHFSKLIERPPILC
jgi:hypothetical protein